MKIVVYVLCYHDISFARAHEEYGSFPWARILRLDGISKYLEGVMYLDVLESLRHEWGDADYVGTLSWKARDKINIPDMHELCVRAAGADVIALMPCSRRLLEQATSQHARFGEVWTGVLERLGYAPGDATDPSIPAFFCNYWLAPPRRMDEYCAFYRRAVAVLETEGALQDALWSDSGYANWGTLSRERCVRMYGVPYFPYHAFMCERLPCFFFWKHARRGVLVGDDEKTTTAGDDEKTTTAGDDEKTTTAGDDEKTTTAGDDEKTTTAGDDEKTTTAGAPKKNDPPTA
jgi:hypothetical protein